MPSLRDISVLRPALIGAQSLVRRFGFELTYARVSGIKDADLYGPLFQPWKSPQWRTLLHESDPESAVSLDRKYVLYNLLADTLPRLNGEVAECGVYRGGTAIILAELAAHADREVHLFDTFGGMPKTNAERDLHKEGDFAGTSLQDVRKYLAASTNVAFYPGIVPETLRAVEERRFCFAHIDLDIYDAIKSASEFFYSRLEPGGIMVFDDYGWPSCPGARAAVDEFFADKPERLLTLSTGQCVVRRC